VRILLWHVHGSYTTSLVQGLHTYLVPVAADRGPDGRGRAQTWNWPDSVIEITAEASAHAEVDVVVLQRPQELGELTPQWLGGRKPGRDVPAIYLEHNAPQGRINELRHPVADRDDLTLVHVTHFNDVFWDAGTTRTCVIEHGVVDPGHRYTGELPHAAVAINEPLRRARVTGTDLLGRLATAAPLDLFGMQVEPVDLAGVTAYEDLPQHRFHDELARRRVYVHPIRWTSLGLSLLEAMHLGMPVVALATTEVVEAVPPEAGVRSTNVDRLVDGIRHFIVNPDLARAHGEKARAAALERYGLARFLADWNRLFEEVTS
jgi:glycosyltransferase involved in cell wall biosynthesis